MGKILWKKLDDINLSACVRSKQRVVRMKGCTVPGDLEYDTPRARQACTEIDMYVCRS